MKAAVCKIISQYIVLSILFLSYATGTKAQSAANGNSGGSNLFNAGVGRGGSFITGSWSNSVNWINPNLSYEHRFWGTFSLGLQASWGTFTDNYSSTTRATFAGLRASYYLNRVLHIPSNFDVYLGANVGLIDTEQSSVSVPVVINGVLRPAMSFGDGYTTGGSGFYAGGRYYFIPHVGVYTEVGYQSLSYLTVGLAFKI